MAQRPVMFMGGRPARSREAELLPMWAQEAEGVGAVASPTSSSDPSVLEAPSESSCAQGHRGAIIDFARRHRVLHEAFIAIAEVCVFEVPCLDHELTHMFSSCWCHHFKLSHLLVGVLCLAYFPRILELGGCWGCGVACKSLTTPPGLSTQQGHTNGDTELELDTTQRALGLLAEAQGRVQHLLSGCWRWGSGQAERLVGYQATLAFLLLAMNTADDDLPLPLLVNMISKDLAPYRSSSHRPLAILAVICMQVGNILRLLAMDHRSETTAIVREHEHLSSRTVRDSFAEFGAEGGTESSLDFSARERARSAQACPQKVSSCIFSTLVSPARTLLAALLLGISAASALEITLVRIISEEHPTEPTYCCRPLNITEIEQSLCFGMFVFELVSIASQAARSRASTSRFTHAGA